MKNAEQIALACLKSFGYHAELIPESGNKRADIFAECETDRYVIEVKSRLEDPTQLEQTNTQLANGDLVHASQTLGYSDRVDGILRHGLKQINETPKTPNTFNLLWFHAEGVDADLKANRARNTFYGLVYLLPQILASPKAEATQCFYFNHNTSIRLPTVHGLVVFDGRGLQLCLNEFAHSVDEFRKSSIVAKFGTSVLDPRKLELNGEALSIRSKMPRDDEAILLQKVFELTSIHYRVVRLSRHSVSVKTEF